MILDRRIAIFPSPFATSTDLSINLEDIADIVLIAVNEKELALQVDEGLTPYIFSANKVDEIME